MPISARKLVYDTVRKANSFNTGAGQGFSVLDIVSVINEAYEILVENNIQAAETDKKYRDNIRKLEIKGQKLKVKKVGDAYFAQYPENLYKRLNQIAVVSCKDCKTKKRIIPRIVQSDDLHEARRNPYRKANFGWEQLIADEGAGGLYIYIDDEVCFNVDEVYIDYYRKINYIEAPSLVECNEYQYLSYNDELITKDVNFDLDDTYIARLVSDVAVFLLKTDVKDPEATKLYIQKLQTTAQIK